MTEPTWDPPVIPAQLDDTQELDPVDYAEPDPEDGQPTDPTPSPYTDGVTPSDGPQDEGPGA